jgi:hypothetical protein
MRLNSEHVEKHKLSVAEVRKYETELRAKEARLEFLQEMFVHSSLGAKDDFSEVNRLTTRIKFLEQVIDRGFEYKKLKEL